MQKFINNWLRPIELAQAATSVELDLPDGSYRLTLANLARTAFEVVDAEVSGGVADLVRGLEGTAAETWPAGSEIYCSLTAGVLDSLIEQINALTSANLDQALQISELMARVAALEPPITALTVTVELFGSSGAGFFQPLGVGSCSPPSINIPGVGAVEVMTARVSGDYFELGFVGQIDPALIASIEVEGGGELFFATAYPDVSQVDGVWRTTLGWEAAADWRTAAGQQRTVVINFAS